MAPRAYRMTRRGAVDPPRRDRPAATSRSGYDPRPSRSWPEGSGGGDARAAATAAPRTGGRAGPDRLRRLAVTDPFRPFDGRRRATHLRGTCDLVDAATTNALGGKEHG